MGDGCTRYWQMAGNLTLGNPHFTAVRYSTFTGGGAGVGGRQGGILNVENRRSWSAANRLSSNKKY